jgi:glycosyltransferase involved in cell wall biosynthesis
MMKIVYAIVGLTTGGAEIMLYRILSKINRDRFSPYVVCLMDRGTLGDRIEALGIPVYTLGMKTAGVPTPNVIRKLVNIIREIKPDLIQGWMYHGNLAAQFASLFVGKQIPVFWTIQGTVYSLKLEKKMTAAIIKLSAYLSRFTSKVIHVSLVGKNQHEALGYDKKNGCVIFNTVDTSLFVPSEAARADIRAELGLPENAFLIGLVCRYHPMKDHANFLQAAALLLQEYPDIHFALVGTGVVKENESLYQTIEQLGISHRTHLLGERSDMPRITAALDIASSASAYGEGCPLIVGEAMSCGVPCTVTDVGDSGLIVGNTGWVVPPKNPEALAKAWQESIELGSQGIEKLGKAARTRIIESFSLDTVVSEYEALYESVIAKKTGQ